MTTATTLVPETGFIRWRSVHAIWWRHLLALSRVWQVALTWFVIEPAVVLLAVALGIGQLVGEMEGFGTYAMFVAPGIVIGTAMFHAIFECSWSTFERIGQSYYETALTAPVTIPEIVLAELLFAVTRALISTVAVAGFAIAFGWIPLAALPGLMLVSVGVGTVFGGIGLLFAALSPSMHALSLVFTLVATPLYFFSGTFFPIAVLPEWLQPVAWAAPLTPLVELARGMALGELGRVHIYCALYVLALTALLYPLAVHLMRRRLMK
ncbi:MAG: ABC transporter permease [Gammaproteobacteria bacterium]|nr:ABC transporter permease [Gammaproteobacteria bacterium]